MSYSKTQGGPTIPMDATLNAVNRNRGLSGTLDSRSPGILKRNGSGLGAPVSPFGKGMEPITEQQQQENLHE